MNRKAMLSVLGLSRGQLNEKSERLYLDLAFFSAAACNGSLNNKSPELSKFFFWELEAFASPEQTAKKIQWGRYGYAFADMSLDDTSPTNCALAQMALDVQQRLEKNLNKLIIKL